MPKNLNASQENKQFIVDRELLEQFINDTKTEVMEEDLNNILEKELDKPENEMDLRMLDELLEILEPVEVDEKTIEAGRKKLFADPQSGKRPRSRALTYLRRFTLAAAAIVALFFVSLGSAMAMRWTFLLKYLEPIAQTFGISTEDRTEQSVQLSAYTWDSTDNEQTVYTSAEDIPYTFDDYRIRLNNVPDRFSQVSGSFLDEQEMKVFNLFYQGDNEWMNYLVYIFADDDSSIMYEYEKTASQADNHPVGMKNVTFYRTTEDETLSVSWVDRNAHYSIVGCISEDELVEILRDMN